MPLGMEVGLSPVDVVLHGDPPPFLKSGEPPNFRPMFIIVPSFRWDIAQSLLVCSSSSTLCILFLEKKV